MSVVSSFAAAFHVQVVFLVSAEDCQHQLLKVGVADFVLQDGGITWGEEGVAAAVLLLCGLAAAGQTLQGHRSGRLS